MNASNGRILVVAPMKSGSTYAADILRYYFAIDDMPDFSEITFSWEHNLTGPLVDLLRERRFCFNYHMLPYETNLRVVGEESIELVHLWRNLADMIVSLDDHLQSVEEESSLVFVLDLPRFRALPPAERFAFLIDTAVPWYLGFYLRWRSRGVALYPYEWMLADRHAYFSALIQTVSQAPADAAALERTLTLSGQALQMLPRGALHRFNVGTGGRSAAKFDEPTKRRLEERLLSHPDREQLEILLWELPWEVPALAPRTALDGAVVAEAATGARYFVSRAVAYPIARDSWLRSRTGERREPHVVATAALNACALGATLV